MDSVTQIRVAWALRRKNVPVDEIGQEVGRHRATLYRWFKGVERYGIEGYIRHYREAKKGRRLRKTHPYVAQRVLSLRREYRECCGQKIVYLLQQEGIALSLSTVYRILNKHLKPLRKHTRTALHRTASGRWKPSPSALAPSASCRPMAAPSSRRNSPKSSPSMLRNM